MILAITGTPGTGKTSVCKSKAHELECIDLNSVIEEHGFYTGLDRERGCLIADLNKLEEYVRQRHEHEQQEQEQKLLVLESHLAHLLKPAPDVAIVLRANPAVLAERLKQKGFPPQKINENVEAETLDVILIEAVELCDIVYEVDTSEKRVEEVATVVREIIDTETEREEDGSVKKKARTLRKKYKPGSLDYTGLDSSPDGDTEKTTRFHKINTRRLVNTQFSIPSYLTSLLLFSRENLCNLVV